MKGCIVVMVSRELHLKVFDSTLLSQIQDYTKILIANRDLADKLTEFDRQCYDEILFVSVIAVGSYALYYDKQELIETIRPMTKKYSPEQVTIFAADEFNVEIVAEATSILGVNGYRYEKAEFFRDKALMKSYLRQHSNVRIPKHMLLTPLPAYQDLVDRLGSSFVAKPVAAAGAAGVYFIHSEKEWNDLRKERNDNFSDYEAETFLAGQLFHVDSVRVNGEIVAYVISEYLHPVGNFMYAKAIGSILIMPDHPAYVSIERLNKDVLDAFNEDGIFHMECFYDERREPVFLEIAWRQAGPPYDINFKEVYGGYSQTLAYVFACLGYPIPEPKLSDFNRIDFYLPKQQGVFNGLVFPELDSKIVDEVLKFKVGEEIVEQPKMFTETSASFAIINPNYESLYQDFLTLRKASLLR